ncbi:type IIG restriction modification enzyme [Haloarcula virus HCTV-8]|nr:type IIG restriction modification enzyme [Haloarcula virus HCTV-8]UBF21050.1 type IIG restriction modification enzyme [Haloarcula virus HCTV-10]
MVDTSEFLESLHGIASRLDEDMSEKDVENAFLNENFFNILGYEGAGYDLRSEWTLPDDRRPDYVTLDESESVTAVFEFKTTGRDLSPNEDQLFHYVNELKADYGVLTNGQEFRLYKREGRNRIVGISLENATESDAADIASALKKPEWDITDPDGVQDYIASLEEVELNSDLGREHFFDTFRLEENSPFADLVTALMDLLVELRDEQEAKFVTGAYDFWEASYASEPDETPDSWEPFIEGEHSLRDFMFCLESGHALLARLLLAKATEDHDFFRNTAYGGMSEYFRGLEGFGDNISLDAYPVAANGLIEDMEEHLVQSLFEDDIFIWWTDGFAEQMTRSHASRASQFQDVAKGTGEVTKISPATRDRFSRAIAHVFFSVLKFDFEEIEGDLLGDLYQHYFDPETRKALGEFYTPQPVIDYIMDGVDYNVGVSGERLIDPSCGSGTFLVEAVNRYIEDVRRYNDDPDWEEHLTDLCTTPHIVGLDIHPFAVLMAQIRFMVAILPEYRDAKEENRDFTIRRLPIYRTDTLRNERELTGIDLGNDGQKQMTLDGVTDDNQDVKIPVPLPVEVDEDEVEETEDGFLVQRVRMPLYDTARLNASIHNFGEYFAALQGVLDVVKWYMEEETWEYSGGLEQGIYRYTNQEYDGIEEFFAPYVDDILNTVQYLREEHGDGRLFKIFEDTVLALVVKNYMDYDYVVGNPPYVRIQHLPDQQKAMLEQLYDSTTGNYDLYCPFYERGLDFLKDGNGKLGYITPNQFMVTDYGEGIRRVLLRDSRLDEIYDFRDSGVFEDATNYPAIVIAEDEPDEDVRENNEIRCVRVKGNVDEDSGPSVDEEIIEGVREHRGEPGYSDDYIDVFDYPQSELDENYWPLCPPEERKILNKLDENRDAPLEEVVDSAFAGTQTSANKVFVVVPVNADRIEAGETGDVVRVIPQGEEKEYEIETDLLKPWLQGRDIERWRGDWSGQHVISPYRETDEGDVELIPEDYIRDELPLSWDYFEAHKETLEGREGGKWEGRDDWYAFGYPKSMERFEKPKLIGAEIAGEATFMLDEKGTWYFKAGYGVQLEPQYQNRTEVFSALLNSNVLDFYLKHITSIKMGGYYKYTSHYLEPLPVSWGSDSQRESIENTLSEIVTNFDTENRVDRFPEAYLGEYDGNLDYINYEWETRRYPVNADIQEKSDGRFAVTAGRSDEITHPVMDSGNREVRKLRAKYVHAAVDGRNMKKGEEQTIPIPQTRRGVEQLIESFEEDRETIENASIDELESEIDSSVYDIFELTDEEREVVEEYMEVF